MKALKSSSAGQYLSADMAACRMVPEVAKQFFPEMAVGFDDPRVQVHITDGIKYVQEAAENSFDVIIVDSSDPVGPAEVLFQKVTMLTMQRVTHPTSHHLCQAQSASYKHVARKAGCQMPTYVAPQCTPRCQCVIERCM